MKFQIFKDSQGEHRFRIVGGNNKIVAASEGYQRRSGMFKTIRALQDAGLSIPVFDEKGREVTK